MNFVGSLFSLSFFVAVRTAACCDEELACFVSTEVVWTNCVAGNMALTDRSTTSEINKRKVSTVGSL